jgi:hypothetical protein
MATQGPPGTDSAAACSANFSYSEGGLTEIGMRTLLWVGVLAAGLNVVLPTSVIAANMMLDIPLKKAEVQAVCTGVGSAKQDSRWAAYSVRVVFSNRASQYIVGEHVVLSQAGKQKAVLDCGAPWILFKLPEGSYSLKATLPDQAGVLPRGATFTSKDGASQQRVGIMFPELQPNE